jgi:hypothetical protein
MSLEIEGPSSPEPICEDHGSRITRCIPCCVRIYEEAGGMDEFARHSWAVSNVYRAKELW